MTIQDIIAKTNAALDAAWDKHPGEMRFTIMIPQPDWAKLRENECIQSGIVWNADLTPYGARRSGFQYARNHIAIAGDRYEARPGVWVPE